MNRYETVADLKNCKEDIVVFGVGYNGKEIIDFFIENEIKITCICDNAKNKHGTTYKDLKINSFNYIIKNINNPLFIISSFAYGAEIMEQLENSNSHNYYLLSHAVTPNINKLYLISKLDVLNNEKKIQNDKALLKTFKDKHKGQRCFIIGNGPSLKAEDLEKIKDEYSIASNLIYKIYDKTSWRQTYYTSSDPYMNNTLMRETPSSTIESEQKFCIVKATSIKIINDDFCAIQDCFENLYPDLPNISNDALKGFYKYFTITYHNIQLALFMGFSELIFLGLDHNYINVRLPDDTTIKTDCKRDHFYDDSEILAKGIAIKGSLSNTTLAYEKARMYADENGIKMLNATRGGKLEVFERVDFDTLF